MAAAHAEYLQYRRNRDLIDSQQVEHGIDERAPYHAGKLAHLPGWARSNSKVISGFGENML